jgi:hypothetical protein
MVKKLSGLFPERTLFRVVALIEATIPFRADDERGAGPFEHLAQRLVRTAEALGFPISQQEADETVHWAVALANRDVANFSNNDPVAFLESTWTLLPESNPSLRRGSVYLIGDYRRALESMRQFLSSIPAENVLHAYKGVPPDDELEAKLDKIRFNLALSVKYFDLKLLCMAVLEALAHTTGGDVPVFQFLGDITIENASGLTGLFSTGTTDAPGKEPPTALIKLLQRGVRGAVDFTDVRTAPLAVYLYQQLDPQMLNAAIASAHELFAGRINPGEFLSRLDQPMLAHIIVAVAQIAVDRREKLENIAVEKIIH